MSNPIDLTAQTLIDSYETKAYDSLSSGQFSGFFLSYKERADDFDFWIRSDPTVWTYSAYSAITAYVEGDKVTYNGQAYKASQSTTDNTPSGGTSDNTYWDWLWTDATETANAWPNVYLRVYSQGTCFASIDLYPLTTGDVQGSLIKRITITGTVNGDDTVATLSLAPGKYRASWLLRTGIGSSDYRVSGKQWDNTIAADDRIRAMREDYQDLEPAFTTELTFDLRSSGRLSQSGYLGGSW